MDAFANSLMCKYPHYFRTEWMEAYPDLKRGFENLSRADINAMVLRAMLYKDRLLPKVPEFPIEKSGTF